MVIVLIVVVVAVSEELVSTSLYGLSFKSLGSVYVSWSKYQVRSSDNAQNEDRSARFREKQSGSFRCMGEIEAGKADDELGTALPEEMVAYPKATLSFLRLDH